jgi:putative endonuclease
VLERLNRLVSKTSMRLVCIESSNLSPSAVMFYAYILRSKKDGTHYYGSTQSLQVRISDHNGGRVRYTKGHRPYVLHYFESYRTKQAALAREKFFKSIEGYKWLRKQGIIV